MSYIGKNPKVDSVKLDGSATVPTGASVEGQVYYNTGTGSISKGLKVYKNSQFVSIDKQLGDADTFHLLKASDLAVSEWSAARNSTSTSYLNQNAVPFETTTGTGVAGAFSNTSTGDALLTDESADLVFNYKSSGTSDDAQEYFGIPLTIPKAFRGGNIVLSFVYRTENDGSDATADGQFEVSILDKSTGNGGQTYSTNTTAVASGADITLNSKTGLAAGQRVRLESGGESAVGDPDATVTEAYITEVSSTATAIKISEDYTPATASGSRVTAGWLTDISSGQLPGADSDTDKQGKQFSLQFKTEDDTSDIVLWFQNKNTSSTDSFELFVDNILFSANKFLQASSKGKPEIARYVTYDSYYNYTPYYTTENENTFTSKYGTWQMGSSTTYTYFEASCRCKVTMSVWQRGNASGDNYTAIILNNLSATDPLSTDLNAYRVAYGKGLDNDGAHCTAEVILNSGDTIRPAGPTGGVYSGQEYLSGMNIMVEPLESESIILESQDEIFTDWVDWTPTGSWTSNVTYSGKWRRVGSEMEVLIMIQATGTMTSTGALTMDAVPSGYSVDESQLLYVGEAAAKAPTLGIGMVLDGPGGHASYATRVGYNGAGSNEIAILVEASNGTYGYFEPVISSSTAPFAWATGDYGWASYKVPIQGWNANFNPLLSMPLVDLGQPVEGWIVPFDNANEFWDATGTCFLFNKALLKPYPNGAAGTIADSKFISIQDQTSGTNTVTSVKAKQDIILNISANGWLNSSSYIEIYSSADQLLGADQQFNSGNYSGNISRTVELKAGDYVYCKNQGFSRHGGMTLTAQKIQSGNMAHIIKPAVMTFGWELANGTNPGTTSATTWNAVTINKF